MTKKRVMTSERIRCLTCGEEIDGSGALKSHRCEERDVAFLPNNQVVGEAMGARLRAEFGLGAREAVEVARAHTAQGVNSVEELFRRLRELRQEGALEAWRRSAQREAEAPAQASERPEGADA
ncbi:MAG: hypothetical protein QW838_04270 [Candidatus Nitrosotenuis sp.]